eukprot:m.36308 g.36308  ORF g.36308 m.36308 type:complete len:331 (+) comp9080_c0_seq4:101-1093(+)
MEGIVQSSFWGCELSKKKKENVAKFEDAQGPVELQLTQITLGKGGNEPTRVLCTVDAPEGMGDKGASGGKFTAIMCTLTPGKVDQCAVELSFSDEVKFHIEGPGPVYLLGNLVRQLMLDEDYSDVSDEEEIAEALQPKQKGAKRAAESQATKPTKKSKKEEEEDDEDEDSDEDDEDDEDSEEEEKSKTDLSKGKKVEEDEDDDEDDDDDDDDMDDNEDDEDDDDDDEDSDDEDEKPAPKKNVKQTPAKKGNEKKGNEGKKDNKKDNKKAAPKAGDVNNESTDAILEKVLKAQATPKKQKGFTNYAKHTLKLTDDKKIEELWGKYKVAKKL